MDPIIRRLPAERDGDLMLIRSMGIAYQADMSAGRVEYDDAYWAKVSAYENSEIACKVLAGRVAMLRKHAKPGASVIDIGCGTGAFVRNAIDAGFVARGFDVMPTAVERLKRDGLYAANVSTFDVVTMWDAIEHMENPHVALEQIKLGALLMLSIPVFLDITRIRKSKHYRPGEHLYYFGMHGLVDWLSLHGFRFIEGSYHECEAGRESIMAFTFRRDRE